MLQSGRGQGKKIKQLVIDSPVVYFAETGIGINGKREWLQVASTETLTCYAAHPKRGRQAADRGEQVRAALRQERDSASGRLLVGYDVRQGRFPDVQRSEAERHW